MAARTAAKNAWRVWYEPAAIPIWITTAFAVGGSTWYIARLARGSDIVWDRHNNPEPWNRVKQNENTKMWAINQKFENKFKRTLNIGAYEREGSKEKSE